MTEVEIRRATAHDIEGIRGFLDAEYRKDWFVTERHIRRMVVGDRNRRPLGVYLAIVDGEIVGLAITSLSGTLLNLLVREDMRGKGIGSKLLRRLRPRFVRCKTDASSGNPIDFYKRQGYSEYAQLDLWGNMSLEGRNRNIVMLRRTCWKKDKLWD